MREQEKLHDIGMETEVESKSGLELAEGEKLDQVVDTANNLHDKMKRDEPVKVGDVDKLEEALGKVEVDFFGEKMTTVEIRRIPNIKRNIEIYNNGFGPDFDEITYLPKGIAEKLIETANSQEISIFLNGLNYISNDVARLLSQCKKSVYLNGVKKISDEQARYFSEFMGLYINLDGLEEASDNVIESLSENMSRIKVPAKIRKMIEEYITCH